LNPRFAGLNPAEDDGFLWAIKIRRTISFGREVKASSHVVGFFGMLKITEEYERDTSSAKFKDISSQLPASLLDVSVATRELWWMNQ
jgi:hypothetical protein